MVKGASASEVDIQLKQVVKDTEKMAEAYGEAITSGSPAAIADAIRESEKVWVRGEDLVGYCSLRYCANTTDKEATQLYDWSQRARSSMMQLRKPLELKLAKMVLATPELIQSPELADYAHLLKRLRASAPYYLSEQEETMIIAKDVYGIDTMAQLQESWVSEKTFEIEVQGQLKTVPYSVLSAMRMNPDRSVREMASTTLYKSYADDKLLHGTALRSICADHVTMTKRRKMPSTMIQALLANDVDEATVESLLKTIEGTADKYQKFLKLKAKLMGLDKLAGHDIIAPITEKPAWKFDWPEARSVVVDSFTAFDGAIGNVVEDMFTSRLIDAANRVGKTSGAFCSWWPGAKKSYVLLSFNGTMSNVFMLAHENGHAAQDHMIFHAQAPSNYESGACMAETGSIFGELLLAEKLLSMSDSDEKRLEILVHVLGDFFYTVYYVGVRALFEKSMYSSIQDGALLDADKACGLWTVAKSRIFGDSVDWSMSPGMEYEWARISHHFIPNYRFYNWPYSFAQMLVYALYESYNEGDPVFMTHFKKLLAAGGSLSPKDQIALVGHDITDPKFWGLGAKQADRFLDELKKLI